MYIKRAHIEELNIFFSCGCCTGSYLKPELGTLIMIMLAKLEVVIVEFKGYQFKRLTVNCRPRHSRQLTYKRAVSWSVRLIALEILMECTDHL